MTTVTIKVVCQIMLVLGLAQVICSQNILEDILNMLSKKDGSNNNVYNVGDAQNWNPRVDYNAWAAGKKFSPGDVLEFKYPEGLNVKQVTANNFQACRGDNALFSDHSGKTSFPLKAPGDYYFICSAFDYCKMGMKLKISVTP